MTLCTLAAPATHLLEVKHSRFLAQAVAVDSADGAQAALAPLGDPAATHNCWAWRVGTQYRSSDDGEPAGTAGRPILAAIDGQGCDQVLVVVTRWFGGIKLGAGGLVRAYGGAAAECLRRAAKRPLIAMSAFGVRVAFAGESVLRQLATEFAGEISEERYDADGLACHVTMPTANVAAFSLRLRDASRGRASIQADAG